MIKNYIVGFFVVGCIAIMLAAVLSIAMSWQDGGSVMMYSTKPTAGPMLDEKRVHE